MDNRVRPSGTRLRFRVKARSRITVRVTVKVWVRFRDGAILAPFIRSDILRTEKYVPPRVPQ